MKTLEEIEDARIIAQQVNKIHLKVRDLCRARLDKGQPAAGELAHHTAVALLYAEAAQIDPREAPLAESQARLASAVTLSRQRHQ